MERGEFGYVEDIVNFPGGREFNTVRDVTDLFDDFKRAMSFVIKFVGRGVGRNTFSIEKD